MPPSKPVTETVKKRRRRMKMPDPIPDTLENVIDAVLNTPPRKRSEWKFIQEHEGVANGTNGSR